MVIQLEEYDSASDIMKAVDEEIATVKNRFGEYLARLDKIRIFAERSKEIRKVVIKLAGKKRLQEVPREVSIEDLVVTLDVSPFLELRAIDKVVHREQDRLLALQKAREALKWLDQIDETEQLKFLVLEEDKVPKKIFFKVF